MATNILKEQYDKLQQENEQYNKLISQQKDHLDSLDKEVIVAESRIQEKLTVPGGLIKQQGKHSKDRKRLRALENKLNQDTIKFDKVLCRNMDYRVQIPHLLQQKGIGCKIEAKFNRQLAIQQNIMEKLGEKFTFVFHQSSEAESQMLEARERVEVETVHFTKRQTQLRNLIDHDAKLHTFMQRKLQEVILLEDDDSSKNKKKQQQYENGVRKLEMYMQAHSKLVELTGERDLRRIDHMFIQNEQKNFAHVNYINELHNRKNMLKNRTDKIKSDILVLEQENKGHDEQSKSQLKDLESELEKYSCLADSLEKQCTVFKRTLDQLKTANNGLLDKTMQEAVTVPFDNITHFTSILEDSIINLLIQANNMEDEQMESAPQKLLLANSQLLPECEVTLETERRTPSRSLKSA